MGNEKDVGAGSRPSDLCLQHVALNVADLAACELFYCKTLGMSVVWRPDEESVFLTNGSDNLALHQAPTARATECGRLDHIGFTLAEVGAVDAWYEFLVSRSVPIVERPRTHRDGTRSLYCKDPDGNTVQLLQIQT